MINENKKIIEVAKNIVINILNSNMNKESFYDIFEINNGNKEILLGHLKAINNITGRAIKILGDKE